MLSNCLGGGDRLVDLQTKAALQVADCKFSVYSQKSDSLHMGRSW